MRHLANHPFLLLPVTMLALTGCAGYAPQPLGSTAAPVTSGALAATPVRPYLQPVTIDMSQPLDANAVATLAVIANPDLKALRTRAKISDAQVFTSGLLPDPTFSMGADDVVSGPDTKTNLTAALGFDLNALRKRGTARVKALAEVRQVHYDLAWSEWQTSGQARLQAVRILALQRKLAIDSESDSVQADLLVRTQRAAGRGDIAADPLQTARMAAFDASDKHTTTQRSLGAARFELTRLLGAAPETPIALAATPLPDAPPDAATLVSIAIARRADLAALREGYAAQEAGLHLAVMDQFPALNLTLNVNRDSADNLLVGPAVDFTLPLWNRNQGGIRVERSTRDALKAEYEARLFQTRAEITAAVADIALLRTQHQRLLADMPATQAFADASAKAAAHGDLSRATAETARQGLRDKQSQVVQAEQDIAELTISLELLTGVPQGLWTQKTSQP